MGHFLFKGKAADNVTVLVQLVIRERTAELACPVEHPTAEARGGSSSIPQVLVAKCLELFIRIVGVIRPIDLKAEHREREYDEEHLPDLQAAIRNRLSQAPVHEGRKCF